MALMPRLRRDSAETSPRVVRRSLPPAGALRRERRALLRAREEQLRDLGGLTLEMVRRGQFRQDLLVERGAALVALEHRLAELETLLSAVLSRRHTPPAARCECGAPVFWGAKFCAQCGRALAERA